MTDFNFVRDKINPVLGKCFNEGAGRVVFASNNQPEFASSSDADYLRARTDEMIAAIVSLVRSMRELKGSRNFPGENPSPEYDTGIEDCVRAIVDELTFSPETSVEEKNERAAWLDEKKANEP